MNNNYLNYQNNNNLYGPYEGFIKGNLFKNLYNEYKNYKPINPNINSEKEELLFNLDQICFAMHELNLYLDVYPNDQNYLNLYTEYENTYNKLLYSYEQKYGPINVNNINDTTPFSWVNTKFPWEVI